MSPSSSWILRWGRGGLRRRLRDLGEAQRVEELTGHVEESYDRAPAVLQDLPWYGDDGVKKRPKLHREESLLLGSMLGGPPRTRR